MKEENDGKEKSIVDAVKVSSEDRWTSASSSSSSLLLAHQETSNIFVSAWTKNSQITYDIHDDALSDRSIEFEDDIDKDIQGISTATCLLYNVDSTVISTSPSSSGKRRVRTVKKDDTKGAAWASVISSAQTLAVLGTCVPFGFIGPPTLPRSKNVRR
jgi:hypothetical protein